MVKSVKVDAFEQDLVETCDRWQYVLLNENKNPIRKDWKVHKPVAGEVYEHWQNGGQLGLIPERMGCCVFEVVKGNSLEITSKFGMALANVKNANGRAYVWYYAIDTSQKGGKFWVNDSSGNLHCRNWLYKGVNPLLVSALLTRMDDIEVLNNTLIDVAHVSMSKEQQKQAKEKKDKRDSERLTQYELAAKFIQENDRRLRYSHETKSWYRFDGMRWASTDTDSFGRAISQIKQHGERVQQTFAFTNAVVKLASVSEYMQVKMSQFDSQPKLIGMPNYTYDFDAWGERKPRFDDYVTLSTNASLSDKDSDLWLKFLNEFMSDDATRHYLQLLFGQSLIGVQTEHILPFLVGTGKNGKTVFIEAIKYAMGNYAGDLDSENLIQVPGMRHSTDWAELRGKRLVVVDEMPDNAVWNISRIKQVTGGGELTARFLYQNNFTFTPAFTMIVLANDKPRLRTVDDSIRRRFRLIPCTFKPERVDTGLGAKLQKECDGIMKWLLDGANEYLDKYMLNGRQLEVPKLVQDYSDEYFEVQDPVTSLIGKDSDSTEYPYFYDSDGKVLRSEVLRVSREVMPMMRWTQPKLAQALEKHSIIAQRFQDGYYYCGISETAYRSDNDRQKEII